MTYDFTHFVNVVGVFLGLVFIILNIRASRTLTGSFFKKYYRLMTAGAVIFTFGFLSAFAHIFGANENLEMMFLHFSFLAAAVIFILTSLALPKEAGKYMNERERK
jgi:uncharacterized PurR-regulated membrane protein YhhQ (DUF165 family)